MLRDVLSVFGWLTTLGMALAPGALRAEESGLRLAAFARPGWLLAQADTTDLIKTQDGSPAYPQPYGPNVNLAAPESPCRRSLELEYQMLDQQKPGLGGPITLMALGPIPLFISWAFLGVGYSDINFSSLLPWGYAFLAAGVAMEALGVVFLVRNISKRSQISARMDEIDEELKQVTQRRIIPPNATVQANLPAVRGLSVPVATF